MSKVSLKRCCGRRECLPVRESGYWKLTREGRGQSIETCVRTTTRIENVEGAGGACLVSLRKNGRSGPLTTVTVVFSRTEGVIMTLQPSANTKGDRE